MPTVKFTYSTGIRQALFSNVRLSGSWDTSGKWSSAWTTVPMTAITGTDGCPAFEATVDFDPSQVGTTFAWGVFADGPGGPNRWGIPTEVCNPVSTQQTRSFQLANSAPTQHVGYHLTTTRHLGARKVVSAPGAAPSVAFRVWAPNAQAVSVVFGLSTNGYIDDNDGGIDPGTPAVDLVKDQATGIWTNPTPLPSFASMQGKPYMYRIKNEQGSVCYRTDLYSLEQIGQGDTKPTGAYAGAPAGLDGTVSCSVIVDPDAVAAGTPAGAATQVPDTDFWADELSATRPLPTKLEDAHIYELHVGSLGYGKTTPTGTQVPGNLNDAIKFLDYLVQLGVNAVELLPMSQYDGTVAWGYGDSHFFAIQSSAGGRDAYKAFVKACHQRGIAVIQDVVYNHYDAQAERAEWNYDSTSPNHNIYYWYEGLPSGYPRLRRRLRGQWVVRVDSQLLAGASPVHVHQQRRGPNDGLPCRWVPRGSDRRHSRQQRVACQREAPSATPTRSAASF